MAFWLSFFFLIASAFFVSAEYALVSSRRSRIEELALKNTPGAKKLLHEMGNLSRLIAACQIGITMIGIAVGALTEPYAATELQNLTKGYLDPRFSFGIGFLLVSLLLVVLGELAPKYATLIAPERAAIFFVRPIAIVAVILKPLIWLAEELAHLVLRIVGIRSKNRGQPGLSKEELLLLIQSNSGLDYQVYEFVSRTLKLNSICARDVMIHRLDVKWIDADLSLDETFRKLAEIPYGRVPVCKKDIDEIIGIVYAQDMFKTLSKDQFNLADWVRPTVFIPENLTLEKVLARMREAQAQMLVVSDEYGGTSGIVTLEDISEEIFGDLEDNAELNPQILQKRGNGIYSVKASARLDEIASNLGFTSRDFGTQSLASILAEKLDRIPKRGDEVEFEFGKLRVLSLHNRRIQQVELRLNQESLALIGKRPTETK